MIVRPCTLIARSRSHRLRRACGSSAAVGSSRNTSSGSWTSAQAIDSRCICPPESFSVRVSALSVSPTVSSISSALAGPVPYRDANVRICSRVVSRSKNDDACNWTPIRGRSAGLRGQGGVSNIRTSPESASRRPSMISSVVVLPAPLGPRMPKNSPDSTAKETPSTACVSPYHLRSSLTTMLGGMGSTLAARRPPRGVHPAIAVDVGQAPVGHAVEVVVVVGALQDAVTVGVVPDEVDPAVAVAVLEGVDAAVRVPHRHILVPVPVAGGVDARVVVRGELVRRRGGALRRHQPPGPGLTPRVGTEAFVRGRRHPPPHVFTAH